MINSLNCIVGSSSVAVDITGRNGCGYLLQDVWSHFGEARQLLSHASRTLLPSDCR